jgi:hypothetical protein
MENEIDMDSLDYARDQWAEYDPTGDAPLSTVFRDIVVGEPPF